MASLKFSRFAFQMEKRQTRDMARSRVSLPAAHSLCKDAQVDVSAEVAVPRGSCGSRPQGSLLGIKSTGCHPLLRGFLSSLHSVFFWDEDFHIPLILHLNLSLSVYQSINLTMCMFLCLSAYLSVSVNLFTYLCLSISLYLLFCLFLSLSVFQFISLSISLFICLYIVYVFK